MGKLNPLVKLINKNAPMDSKTGTVAEVLHDEDGDTIGYSISVSGLKEKVYDSTINLVNNDKVLLQHTVVGSGKVAIISKKFIGNSVILSFNDIAEGDG